jgi:hypothetical protein
VVRNTDVTYTKTAEQLQELFYLEKWSLKHEELIERIRVV